MILHKRRGVLIVTAALIGHDPLVIPHQCIRATDLICMQQDLISQPFLLLATSHIETHPLEKARTQNTTHCQLY